MQREPIAILALFLAWANLSLATAHADEGKPKPKHKVLGADKSTAVPPPGTPSSNKPQAAYVYNISQNSITLEIPNLVSPSTIVAASPDMKELFDNERFMGKFGKLTTYPTIEGKHSVSLPTDLKKGEWIETVIGTKTLYGYDGISMPTMQSTFLAWQY